jgi:RimJ/RimL family protein N-acetyltransferase
VINPFLIGTNLYLRPLERADAPLAVAWLNDPEVSRTLRGRPPLTLRAEEEFIDRVNQSEHDLTLVIVLRDGDRPIGMTGLHAIDYRNRHASFGITIGDKNAWGKGHGTEVTRLMVRHAFWTLNLNRVWLEVFEYNPGGQRVYEKVGFRREGVLRQAVYRDGRYWDTIVMAVLRQEWDDAATV